MALASSKYGSSSEFMRWHPVPNVGKNCDKSTNSPFIACLNAWLGTPGGLKRGTPDSAAAGAGTPGAVTPGAATPGVGTPGVGTPGAGTPGAGTPGAGTPGASTPGAGTPGAGTQSHLHMSLA